jgi:hypothetical protein
VRVKNSVGSITHQNNDVLIDNDLVFRCLSRELRTVVFVVTGHTPSRKLCKTDHCNRLEQPWPNVYRVLGNLWSVHWMSRIQMQLQFHVSSINCSQSTNTDSQTIAALSLENLRSSDCWYLAARRRNSNRQSSSGECLIWYLEPSMRFWKVSLRKRNWKQARKLNRSINECRAEKIQSLCFRNTSAFV